jgi:hypothetical protein
MKKLILCSAVLLLASPIVMADYVLSSNDNWVRRFTDDFATQVWSTTINNAASTVLFGPNGDVYVMRITGQAVDHLDYETGAYIGTVVPTAGSTVNYVGGGTVVLQAGGSANAESMTFGDIGGPAGFGLAYADGVPDLILNRRDKIEIYDGTSLNKTGTGSETWATLLFQKYRADSASNTEDGTGGQGVLFGPNYGLPSLYVMKGVNTATSGVYEGRFHIYDLSSPTLEDVALVSGQGQRDSGTMILGPDVDGDGQKDLWSIDNRSLRINAYDPATGNRVATGIPIVDEMGAEMASNGLRFPTNIAPGPNGSILVTTRFRTWLDPSWTGAEAAGGNLLQLVWDKTNLRAVATLLYELPNDTGRLDGMAYLGADLTVARDPSPSNGAGDVFRDTPLSWTPGQYAATHDIYFGTSSADVEAATRANPLNVLAKQDHDASTYSPGRLEFSTTYYWRVDEVNAAPDNTIVKGDVWSFTVEPASYPVENIVATASIPDVQGAVPQNTVNGSGLDSSDQHSNDGAQMWLGDNTAGGPVWIQYEFDGVYRLSEMKVWNYNSALEPFVGFAVKDATIEYSIDGSAWTAAGAAQQFIDAPGTAGYAAGNTIALDGIAARYVRINIQSNWGVMKQYGLSEVRFYYEPVQASQPQPASGATGVTPDVTLTWRPGREAGSHEVYLSTDQQAVQTQAASALVSTTSKSSYAPSALNLQMTYYWKVNEVNATEAMAAWPGNLWSFSTADFLVVDDFESYTNDSPKRVFQTWRDGIGFSADSFFPDGYDGNGTGSIVGYDPQVRPIMETATVHSGAKSMPFEYDNTTTASVTSSEATRTFDTAQDWTKAGITTLVLYVYGDPNNASAQLYVKVSGTPINYNGDAANLTKASWSQCNFDLAAVATSSLKSVSTLTIGTSGGKGHLLIDDIRLYRVAPASP